MSERPSRRGRRSDDDHDPLDRWLISYSDFLTLMFTFFAALYALSTVDHEKAGKFSSSLRQAFHVIEVPVPLIEESGRQILNDVRKSLEDMEGIAAKSDPRGVVVTLSNDTAFVSGSADLRNGTSDALDRLVAVLQRHPGRITIEGHADNVPIAGRYRSNWELSTARASSVLHRFLERGLDPSRVAVAGYGEFRPIATNETEDGKARNRRVEIILSPQTLR